MSSPGKAPPAERYKERLAHWEIEHRRARGRHTAWAWARVAALVGFIVAAYESCGDRGAPVAFVYLAVGAFVILAILVGRAARGIERAAAAEEYFARGLARLRHEPPPDVPTGTACEPGEHPYAADLDLFGPQSLFSMLCQARTSSGQERLANWLLEGAGKEEVLGRQEAVTELRERLDLREALWQAAGTVGREVHPQSLAVWLDSPTADIPAGQRIAAAAVAVVGLAGAVALLFGLVPPAVLAFVIVFWFARRFREVVATIAAAAQHRVDELKAVGALTRVIEAQDFRCPRLKRLKEDLGSEGKPASRRIGELEGLVGWFESRRNPFFALVTAPILLTTQLGLAIEVWRHRHGRAAAKWLGTIGEIEALVSLATFSFENPALPFPEILDEAAGARLEGEALAHPLLPAASRVANDVRLGGGLHLLLVTGSNMSGKSTLLRTVGANVVLALAGAPVVAKRLRLSRLRMGASLRTSDSLQAGVSRFFAEIKRLREVVAMSETDDHTLFLLDEVLHGTNSQDRLAGATAIARTLVERGAIGLLTTHDLSLASIVAGLGARAQNVHFRDDIDHQQDGKLHFDYTLRPGVVERGNALALMRLVGLPV